MNMNSPGPQNIRQTGGIVPLYGYTSEDTAFLVKDYPYGRDCCQIRFWLETVPKKGARFCSQTQNPKNGRWNNPKRSTYAKIGGCMYLDEKGHCVWSGLSEYDGPEAVLAFLDRFLGAHVPDLKLWAAMKRRYLLGRIEGKIVFTINGQVSPDTPAELQKMMAEKQGWEEVERKLADKPL